MLPFLYAPEIPESYAEIRAYAERIVGHVIVNHDDPTNVCEIGVTFCKKFVVEGDDAYLVRVDPAKLMLSVMHRPALSCKGCVATFSDFTMNGTADVLALGARSAPAWVAAEPSEQRAYEETLTRIMTLIRAE